MRDLQRTVTEYSFSEFAYYDKKFYNFYNQNFALRLRVLQELEIPTWNFQLSLHKNQSLRIVFKDRIYNLIVMYKLS